MITGHLDSARKEAAQWALAVVLIAIAGWVDAVGFLTLKHLFVSFMSGNSTQLAVAAAQASWRDVWTDCALVASFVTASIVGHGVGRYGGSWRGTILLGVEAVLLAAGASLSSQGWSAALPMAMAMGIQNAVLHKVGDTRISLTYVTGTLVTFSEKVVDAFTMRDGNHRWSWLPYLVLWVGLLAGAAAGAWAHRSWDIRAVLIPAIALCVLAIGQAPRAAPR